ncbi:MAG: CDP-glycerol glycerophosphotransferase family protein [Parcubacteria group bacterium]|nr:CDP-glycerol glycerophosphotransferase family protein [Parcubacteria group bacterium]
MKTVFLVIPNPVITSDILRTRYIEYLASKYRVIVVNPFFGEGAAKKMGYFVSPATEYIKWKLEHPSFWDILKLFRISLIGEFDYLSAVQFFYRRPNFRNNRRRRFLRMLGRPFSAFLTADFFTNLEKLLLPRSVFFESLLKKYNPALLITATPGFDPMEAEVIICAKRAGLTTAAIDFSWDNLTTNCKHIRRTDYLIVWNDIVRDEAIRIHHYDRSKIFTAGVLKFDHYFRNQSGELSREDFLTSRNLNPANKTIVFATKPRIYGEQIEHIRAVIKAREAGQFGQTLNILIRPHILDDPKFYQEFLSFDNVYVDCPGKRLILENGTPSSAMEMDQEDLVNLKHILKYGDVHLQYGSTLALEAAVFDRPVVNIGFLKTMLHNESYRIDHYWPVIKSGAAPLAKDMGELVGWINKYLNQPSLHRENRAGLVAAYIPFQDGLAYQRSVQFLDGILQSGHG